MTVVSTKIALAHRQPMFREGLRSVLASEPDFHVVGQATNGHDALSLVRARKPDLLLLDFEIQIPPRWPSFGRWKDPKPMSVRFL